MDYESILQTVYGNGLYHILITALCSAANFVWGFEMQSIIFLHVTPKFNCSDPNLSQYSNISWVGKKDLIQISTSNFTDLPQSISGSSEQCWAAIKHTNSANLQPYTCEEWNFSSYPMSRTIVTDFNLVCGYSYYVTILESAILLFMSFGYAIASLSDKFSRKKIMILYAVWECITTIALPFAPTFTTHVFVRLLRTLSISIIYLGPCIIQEILPTNKRAIFGNLYWLPFGLGYMSAAGVAYLTKDWIVFRYYGIIALIPYIPTMFILPESPRWLAAHNKPKGFVHVIRNISRWNGVKLPEVYFDKLYHEQINKESYVIDDLSKGITSQISNESEDFSKDTLFTVLRYRSMRIKLFVMCFTQSAIACCYYGLMTNANFTNNNIFLNVVMQGACEMPSAILGWIFCIYIGRRLSAISLLLITSLAVSSVAVIKTFQLTIGFVIAILGRVVLTAVYCFIGLYLAELFPTTVRNMGIYLVATVAGVFSAVAPFINKVEKYAFFLPGCLFGSMCLASAVLVYFFLPETKNCPLAQTISQSKTLVRGNEKQWTAKMNCVVNETIQLENLDK